MFRNLLSLFTRKEVKKPHSTNSKPSPWAGVTSDEYLRGILEADRGSLKETNYSRAKKEEPTLICHDHPRERNEIPAEIKFATYRDGVWYTRAAYAIFHGNRCVFTRADRVGGSTIQHGEYIAQVIARQEGRPLESMRYYDLQTTTGYGRGGGDGVGGLEFDQLILGWENSNPEIIHTFHWFHAVCPNEVVTVFKKYVADSKKQKIYDKALTDF